MPLSYETVREFIFNEDPDEISRAGPFPLVVAIVLLYVLFVKKLGPQFMRQRKAFKLTPVLILHNIFIIYLNGLIVYKIGSFVKSKFDLICKPRHTFDADGHTRYIFKYAWYYYLSKYIDLLDTVFFVLRKKERQISFLHVFHHGVIIILSWTAIYFKARGMFIVFLMPVNSLVHVCTYTYYTLSVFGPKAQKFLWWKKYLTFIQVAQFFFGLAFILGTTAFGCDKLDPLLVTTISFIVSLLLLFANFYAKNYRKKEK